MKPVQKIKSIEAVRSEIFSAFAIPKKFLRPNLPTPAESFAWLLEESIKKLKSAEKRGEKWPTS